MMKKIIFILSLVFISSVFVPSMTVFATESSQNVSPMKPRNPVEKELSTETRKLMAVILKSDKSYASISVSTKKKAKKICYEFRSFLCYPYALSYYKKVDKTGKSYVISATNVSFLKKRIKKVRKVDNHFYKVAKRLYHGKNKRTVRAIANYIRNHISYSRSKRNLYKNDRRGNCVVYVQMFSLLCRMNHIPAKIYYGASSRYAHCWNRVKIGGKWYWSDSCWYDTSHRSRYILSRSLWSDHRQFHHHMTGKYILNMY